MKKNILIALFALLAVALNGNAQNNTYNMVIEMANGTKITIGPNDVKNISFNNGELVMTGEDINSLVERQSATENRIAMIMYQLETITQRINGIKSCTCDTYAILARFRQIETRITELSHQLDALNSKVNDAIQ